MTTDKKRIESRNHKQLPKPHMKIHLSKTPKPKSPN